MRKIRAYNFITLNGFYKGPNQDISWHRHAEEETAYSEQMLEQNNVLLFGRKTYENMVSFWPTSEAQKMFPKVAAGMNSADKIVFSNSLDETGLWENTQLIKGDIIEKMRQLKKQPGKDMVILGSGSIINLFAENDLLDELKIMLDPVAIGQGVPIFNEIQRPINLKLEKADSLKSGVVLLNYTFPN